MTNIDKLIALGRFMIQTAPRFADDVQFNSWSRVGQLLTEVGTPFGKTLAQFSSNELAVVREGAAVATGKTAMPEVMKVAKPMEGKRTRKARMTKTMSKPVKSKAPAKKAKKATKSAVKKPVKNTTNTTKAVPVAKRGRGRPRKNA